MKIIDMSINDIIPYENNPRINKTAIDKVAESIKEFGFQQPIVVDKNNVIIVGHTRFEASKRLLRTKVPVLVAENLTDQQIKAYRLADNKTNEFSKWDFEKLENELKELDNLYFDMSSFGFDLDSLGTDEFENKNSNNNNNTNNSNNNYDEQNYNNYDEQNYNNFDDQENIYTNKVESPTYKPTTTEPPKLEDLYNNEKTNKLINKIKNSNIDNNIKDFLIYASYRHIIFNYENIAEYYSHADKQIQELMEESALVIIDFEKAISEGYVQLINKISENGINEHGEE